MYMAQLGDTLVWGVGVAQWPTAVVHTEGLGFNPCLREHKKEKQVHVS